MTQKAKCLACGHEHELTGPPPARCDQCHSTDLSIVGYDPGTPEGDRGVVREITDFDLTQVSIVPDPPPGCHVGMGDEDRFSKLKFPNRENECVTTTDGRTIWISRSVAVVVHVVVIYGSMIYILAVKRGPGLPDHVGEWCLPCGYLDWDESGSEACMREVWEECRIYLPNLIDRSYCRKYYGLMTDTPWLVVSDPRSDQKQNISLHYGIIVEPDGLFEVAPDEELDHAEVAEIKLFPIHEVPEMAFGHKTRVQQFLTYLGAKCLL